MTDSEFTNWLKHGGRSVTLVEVSTETPRYLSTVAYATLPTDVPANRIYTPIIASGVSFSEKLALDGKASLGYGDIEIHNEDGRFDGWLDDVWVNRAITVSIGDVTWPRSQFVTLFTGVVASFESSSVGRLNIILRDKLERLNTPVTETELGGMSENKDRLVPITLGEVHNVTPLLVDSANHIYQVNSSPTERIIEVRDNGVPVSVTNDLPNGRFALIASPVGTITASVQGRTPYVNTVADCVKTLVKSYGTPTERFTDSDIDLTNFSSFDMVNAQPVGVYLSDRGNVLAVAQELAESVGGTLAMSREGKLRLLKVALPTDSYSVTIGEADYEAGSFQLKERPEVLAGVRLNFCKNWTVQTTLDTGIPSEHKDLFAQGWLTTVVRDSAVAATYRLYAEPEEIPTLLLKRSDATTEAQRRLDLWKVQRNIYSFKGFAHLLRLELGQSVLLKSKRFGLGEGKTGIVVGISSDWISKRADIEVLV